MLKKLVCTLFVGFLSAGFAWAEIYSWTDDDGNVHYGNREKDKFSNDVKKVTIRDKYIIPYIKAKEPIHYNKEEKNRTIAITSVVLDMPNSTNEGVRIGRVTCGRQLIDLYWNKGTQDLSNYSLGGAIYNVFAESGYSAENSIGSFPSGGSLELKGYISNVKMNSCPQAHQSNYAKSASFVEVKWSLYDPVMDKELLTITTKGSHNALDKGFVEDGRRLSFEAAMAASVNNLLSVQKFYDAMQSSDVSQYKEDFDEKLVVKYSQGDGSGRFNQMVEFAKDNSLIVKTSNGHGSGVLINDSGFVLTNAHVVGDESTFEVRLGNNKLKARLIRKEGIRDVALLKIDNYKGQPKGALLARSRPSVGDDLYIIGAPLKLEFQHTITRGIVSAERTINGMPFYQTDAAINPGNSGGGVFDASGELVALAVSGVFTQGGASLNINYL